MKLLISTRSAEEMRMVSSFALLAALLLVTFDLPVLSAPYLGAPVATSSAPSVPSSSSAQSGAALKRLLQATGEMRFKSHGALAVGSYSLPTGLNVVCKVPTDVEIDILLPDVSAGSTPDQRSLSGKVKFAPPVVLATTTGEGVTVSTFELADNSVRCDCALSVAFQKWITSSPISVSSRPLELDSFSSLSIDELFWKPAAGQKIAVGPTEQSAFIAFGSNTSILVSNLKRLADKTLAGSIKVKADSFEYETTSPSPSRFTVRSIDSAFSLLVAPSADASAVELSKPDNDRMVKLEGVEAAAAPGKLQLENADLSFSKLLLVLKKGESPVLALKSSEFSCKGIDLVTADKKNQLRLVSSRISLPGDLVVKGRTWHLDGASVRAENANAKVVFPHKTFELPIHNAKVDLGALNGTEISEDIEVLRATISVKKDWEVFPENKVRTGHAFSAMLAKNSHFHLDQAGSLVCPDWQAKLTMPRLLFEKDADRFELNDTVLNLNASVNTSALSTILVSGRANGLQVERQNFKPAKLSKVAISLGGMMKVDRADQAEPKITLENATFAVPSDRLNGLLTAVVPKNLDLAPPGSSVTDSGVSQLRVVQVNPESNDFILRANGIFHKGISGLPLIGNPLHSRKVVIEARIKGIDINNLPNGKFQVDPAFDKCKVQMPGFFDPVFWFMNKLQITQKIADGFMNKFKKTEISPPEFLESLDLNDPEISASGIKVRFACKLKN